MSEAAADIIQILSALSPGICDEDHLREQLTSLHAQLKHVRQLKADASAASQTAVNSLVQRPRVIIVSYDLPQSVHLVNESSPLSYEDSFKVTFDAENIEKNVETPTREEYLYLMEHFKHSEEYDFVWVGGLDAQKYEIVDLRTIQQKLMENFNCIPVFAYGQTFHYHYNGFSKGVLWPLLHGIPPASIYSIDRNIPVEKAWAAYLQVNEAFAQQILQFYNPDTDVIWIHDYHLFLLPFIIRQQLPDVTIGFFLHTCFPSSEIFRILPYRKQILQGILASDVIAVQTAADAHHLMTSCSRILGYPHSEEGITTDCGHVAQLRVCPVGIDLDLIKRLNEEVSPAQANLLKEFKDRIVLVSVDEMDYVKGITHKLSAFEHFLDKWPEYRQKVVLIQIVFPGRSDCEEYHALQSAVNEQIGRINSKHATVDSLPIRYINRYVSKPELLSIFSVSRVAIITPLKDGMNLLPFQYVACQDSRDPGALILSEFAGCSSFLSCGASVINPWATDEFAEAIYQGINCDRKSRIERHEKLWSYVENHTIQAWTDEIVDKLAAIADKKQEDQ